MKTQKFYVLPQLVYDYGTLTPYISEDLLRLHHDKPSYVNAAQAILRGDFYE